MTPSEIRAAVAADPALSAMAGQADRPDAQIAAALSAGRTRVVLGATISTRGAAAKFPAMGGLPGALAFEAGMLALESFAAAQSDSTSLSIKLTARAVRRQLVGFQDLGLDFGEPALRGMLDQLAAQGVLSIAQANGFKALAEAPDAVTSEAVTAALNGAI